jgi:hypothetical protein
MDKENPIGSWFANRVKMGDVYKDPWPLPQFEIKDPSVEVRLGSHQTYEVDFKVSKDTIDKIQQFNDDYMQNEIQNMSKRIAESIDQKIMEVCEDLPYNPIDNPERFFHATVEGDPDKHFMMRCDDGSTKRIISFKPVQYKQKGMFEHEATIQVY